MKKLLLALALLAPITAAAQTLVPTGGGSSTPCTTTALSLQYNAAGAFGCVSGWTTNGTTLVTGSANSGTSPSIETGTVLQIVGTDAAVARVEADSFGAIAAFTAKRTNGTAAAPTAIVSGNQLGGFNSYGYRTSGGAGYSGPSSSVQSFATENWTSTANGTKVVIATTPNLSTTLTTGLTVDQDQSVAMAGRATIATSLAINAAAIGSNALAVAGNVTGSALFGTSSAGSAVAPSLFVGNGTTGFYSVSTTGLGVSANGALKADFGITTSGQWTFATNVNTSASFAGGNFNAGSTNFIAWNNRALLRSPADAVLTLNNFAETAIATLYVPATNTLQYGAADAAVAVAQTTRVQSVVAGTAAANGANWTLIGSLPTGTGTSGDIIFQTGVKTGSGTTQGTATTALTIKGETQALVTAALDASGSTGGALQVAGGASVAKRFWIPAITASSGLQTAVLCQSSGGEMIADSVACLASGSQFKTILGPMEDGALGKLMNLPMDRWAYKAEGNFKSDDWTRERIGPIAQDVAAMDKRLAGYDNEGNIRTFSTEQLLAFTIKAVQELNAKVEAQR